MSLTRAAWLMFALGFALVPTTYALERQAEVIWPQTHSDLRPDPAISFGSLSNGMKYEIRSNHGGTGSLSIRFRIAVGARNEEVGERGIAHLLEHMAFRGS